MRAEVRYPYKVRHALSRAFWGCLTLAVAGCLGGVHRVYEDGPSTTPDAATCSAGEIACDSACAILASDVRHCGTCLTACKDGEVCGNGRCSASCPEGQANCNASCADLQTDARNCGACGNVCGPDDECVEGKCVVACRTLLNQPLTDAWGWSWDGLERAASSYGDAVNACSQFRGRLPTVSELHRVSATQSATVGQTFNTNPLWSLAPVSPGMHARVRLSDAAIAGEADATKTNYRCVCPPPLPKVYIGNNCFGPARDNACVTLDTEAKAHNIDSADRPPVPKGTAIWECAFYGGHLATSLQLAEAVQQNIGTGSGTPLHSADEVRHDKGAVVSWTDGQNFLFQLVDGPNSVGFAPPTDPHPFRCVGENIAPPALPTIAAQWAGPGRRRLDAADSPPATLIEAVDHCFQSGGHLPTMAELNELVVQGAPAGSDTFLWTSDQTGFDGKNFTVAVSKWKEVDLAHLYGGDAMAWAYKTDTKPYRCAYYPVDTAYLGPQASACSGGCMTLALPGVSGAKSWFDNADRSAATVTAAMNTCRQLGGHLASERDLTEAIRGGLPTGTNTFLHTSDAMGGWCGDFRGGYCNLGGACSNIGGQCGFLGLGRCISNGPTCDVDVYVGNVKWTGTMPTFDDLWEDADGSRMNWSKASDTKPFRCTWTNELR